MPAASRICLPAWSKRREPDRWARGRQGDHDDRHLSEGRDRNGQARRRRCDHQRHRQGRRHDRARHGDDAVLRRDRRADRRAGAAGAAVEGGVGKTFNAVTVDSDTSTSDTLLLFATGAAARRGAPRIADAKDPRLRPFRRGAEQGPEIAGAAGRARRRGRAQAGRGHRDRCEVGALGQAHRAVDRQFAAGQDGDRRRGRQLGPRRHGGRQGRRAGRPRPAVDLVRRQPPRSSRASATRPIRKRRRRPT